MKRKRETEKWIYWFNCLRNLEWFQLQVQLYPGVRMMSLGPHLSPALCAAFLCVGFMLCLSLWGSRVLPSSSQGTICQLGITTERELLLAHGSSKILWIRSHWTSLGHMLLLLQSPWDRVLWLVQPGGVKCGVSPKRAREGTQSRVKVKGPDREMETRSPSHRYPSWRSECACLWRSASNVEIPTFVLCACLWSQVLPGTYCGPGVCQIRDFYSGGVYKALKLHKHFVLLMWRIFSIIISTSKWSTTQITKCGAEARCEMLGYTDPPSTALCTEVKWCR